MCLCVCVSFCVSVVCQVGIVDDPLITVHTQRDQQKKTQADNTLGTRKREKTNDGTATIEEDEDIKDEEMLTSNVCNITPSITEDWSCFSKCLTFTMALLQHFYRSIPNNDWPSLWRIGLVFQKTTSIFFKRGRWRRSSLSQRRMTRKSNRVALGHITIFPAGTTWARLCIDFLLLSQSYEVGFISPPILVERVIVLVSSSLAPLVG